MKPIRNWNNFHIYIKAFPIRNKRYLQAVGQIQYVYGAVFVYIINNVIQKTDLNKQNGLHLYELLQ